MALSLVISVRRGGRSLSPVRPAPSPLSTQAQSEALRRHRASQLQDCQHPSSSFSLKIRDNSILGPDWTHMWLDGTRAPVRIPPPVTAGPALIGRSGLLVILHSWLLAQRNRRAAEFRPVTDTGVGLLRMGVDCQSTGGQRAAGDHLQKRPSPFSPA